MKTPNALLAVVFTVAVALTLIVAYKSAAQDGAPKDARLQQKRAPQPVADRERRMYQQITDLTRRVKRLEAVINAEQKPAATSEDQLKIFSLIHADAKSMQSIVEKLFIHPRGASLRLTADPRTNSLLVYGPESELEVIEAVLQRLDEPVKEKKPIAAKNPAR